MDCLCEAKVVALDFGDRWKGNAIVQEPEDLAARSCDYRDELINVGAANLKLSECVTFDELLECGRDGGERSKLVAAKMRDDSLQQFVREQVHGSKMRMLRWRRSQAQNRDCLYRQPPAAFTHSGRHVCSPGDIHRTSVM